MLSLFLLLFKKSYWRMIFRRATWHEAWLSLLRAHKDRRARQHLGRFLLLILAPALCVGYLSWIVGSGMVYILPVLIPILWWQMRQSRQSKPPTVVPETQPTPREFTPEEKRSLRGFFARLTLFYAVMVDRAGSEGFLKQKVLPEGFEVTARRIYLDLLKKHDLWDRMSRLDREAMMMPDGHWAIRQINVAALSIEPLRLLRWILRIDFYLPLVGQQLRGDFRQSHDLVRAPQKVFDGTELGAVPMIETARDSARHYYVRCLAEEITRGYRTLPEDHSTDWAHEITQALAGKQHDDLVLGDKLVSETERDQLEWATLLSWNRLQYLNWTLAILQTGAIPEEFPSVSPTPLEEPEEIKAAELSPASPASSS